MEPRGRGSEMSRRRFLGLLAGAAAAAALPDLAKGDIKVVPAPEVLGDPETLTIPETSIDNQIVIEGSKNPETAVEVTPEYDRALQRLLLTIPSTPDEGVRSNLSLEYIYGDLLAALPDYTQIDAVVEYKGTAQFKSLLSYYKRLQQTKIHHPNLFTRPVESWAQDYGEVVSVKGEQKFVLPMVVDKEYNKDSNQRLKSRNKVLQAVFPRHEIIQADFFYEGGNMTFDVIDNQLVVFIGVRDVTMTCQTYKNVGQEVTPQQVAERISKTFGDAKVVVMGRDTQAEYHFHIDQSFVILADRQVVMNKYTFDKEQLMTYQWEKHQAQQEYYKKQLQALGYTIHELEVPIDEAAQFHTSVNGVPFRDKDSGIRKIIFPVFPDDINKKDGSTVPTLDKLTGQGLKCYQLFKSLGYDPIPVRDIRYQAKGNTHCITNVLAYLEQHPEMANQA